MIQELFNFDFTNILSCLNTVIKSFFTFYLLGGFVPFFTVDRFFLFLPKLSPYEISKIQKFSPKLMTTGHTGTRANNDDEPLRNFSKNSYVHIFTRFPYYLLFKFELTNYHSITLPFDFYYDVMLIVAQYNHSYSSFTNL